MRFSDILSSLQCILELSPSLDNDKATITSVNVLDRYRDASLWKRVCRALIEILQESSAKESLFDMLINNEKDKPTLISLRKIIFIAILLDIDSGDGSLPSQGRDQLNEATDACVFVNAEDGGTSRAYSIPTTVKECKAIYASHRDLVARTFTFNNIDLPDLSNPNLLRSYLFSCKESLGNSAAVQKKKEEKKNNRTRKKSDKQFSDEEIEWFLHFGKEYEDEYEFNETVDKELIQERREEYLKSIKESPMDCKEVFLFVVQFNNWDKRIVNQKRFRIRLSTPQCNLYLLFSSMKRKWGQPQVVVKPAQRFGEKALNTFLVSTLELLCLDRLSKKMASTEKTLIKERKKELIDKEDVDPEEGKCCQD